MTGVIVMYDDSEFMLASSEITMNNPKLIYCYDVQVIQNNPKIKSIDPK